MIHDGEVKTSTAGCRFLKCCLEQDSNDVPDLWNKN
jgi:hypothetical protein